MLEIIKLIDTNVVLLISDSIVRRLNFNLQKHQNYPEYE